MIGLKEGGNEVYNLNTQTNLEEQFKLYSILYTKRKNTSKESAFVLWHKLLALRSLLKDKASCTHFLQQDLMSQEALLPVDQNNFQVISQDITDWFPSIINMDDIHNWVIINYQINRRAHHRMSPDAQPLPILISSFHVTKSHRQLGSL